MTRILGISSFYHDSAACLVEDGRVVAALQEERFSRKKNDHSFPSRAISACLGIARCRSDELDWVVFYEKPFVKFDRLLETYRRHCPRGLKSYLKAIPVWVSQKLWIKDFIDKELAPRHPVLFADHHESHAASAFFPSPFRTAAILTVDAVGEWSTTALGKGVDNDLQLDWEIRFPHSLGLLYSAFTYYLGFEVNSGEYKLMGLASYGKPVYTDLIKSELIHISSDGSFRLNARYFDYEAGLVMVSKHFEKLLGGPPRGRKDPLGQRHMNLAASIQQTTEEVLLTICRHLQRKTHYSRLCMAGGVALNCVANGRVLRESGFDKLWIQPASGDAGGALGAALSVWHRFLGNPRSIDNPDHKIQQFSLLGTEYNRQQIHRFLESQGANYAELDNRTLFDQTAEALTKGAVVAWFQGRMEFGPRALGNRSILADPRNKKIEERLNTRVKFREWFRPFAPAILEEDVAEYFCLDRSSPYMLLVASVLKSRRAEIPAVTHVDGSARIQTVSRAQNPRFYALLRSFRRLTGCPLLLNTSLNRLGEPIVESPHDAFQCFMRSDIDFLVLDNFVLSKKDQPSGLHD